MQGELRDRNIHLVIRLTGTDHDENSHRKFFSIIGWW
jgi:hypothetical protein